MANTNIAASRQKAQIARAEMEKQAVERRLQNLVERRADAVKMLERSQQHVNDIDEQIKAAQLRVDEVSNQLSELKKDA